eukprot:TRINITY_DN1317_c0_g2_i2.p2 TRINITY_DN1317_c0_g2~~TRINITY_DN1317_c0_g2_i2.p2  ORF type:complete len:319 (+),score=58.70 TRINITY_DN1317_c0_g2_i2:156-1112(+)
MFGILRSRQKRASSTMALQCVRPNCLMLYAGSSRTPIPYRRTINKNSSANIWRQVENLNLKHRRLHCHALKKENGRVTTALKQENSFSVANEKVSAVLFDMDGVLCNSEEASRRAAVELFQEMGVQVTVEDFVPFMGTGEANFLGGVAQVKNVEHFDPLVAKKRFFEIYLQKYAKPNSGLGYEGSLELVTQCKNAGLKVAVASSADRIKVNANLSAAGLPQSYFDAIVSADSFEKLKPAPDIFLAASKALNVSPCECVVIEDALAGVEAAKAANMRCIAVTTTLPEEKLAQAGPSLVRQDIGNISLTDILNCKSTGEC